MRNSYQLLLILAFLLANYAVPAQDTTLVESQEEYHISINDSSTILLDKWKASRDFNYMQYLDSLLRKQPLRADTVRINEHTGDKLPGRKEKENTSFIQRLLNFEGVSVFFWLLAIFFIGFIIYKVFIQSGFFFISRKRKAIHSIEEQNEELKLTSAYDHFIHEAEQKANYNQAIRYWYLKTLKNLKDEDLIHYTPEKTNQEYISELKDSAYQDQFRNLTRNYEYVWYGEFLLQEELYHKIKDSFVVFTEQLTNRH